MTRRPRDMTLSDSLDWRAREMKVPEEQAGVEQPEVGVPREGDVAPIESRRVTPGQGTLGQGTPGQSSDRTATVLEAGPGDGQALTVARA